MKTRKLIYIALGLTFILSSCREIKVKTIVNDNGSFTRVITLRGDSSDVLKKALPYPVDSNWTKEFYRDTTEEKKFICKYSRYYAHDELLQEEIAQDTSWRKEIDRSIVVSKRFMFFYSFITYRETYKALDIIDAVDYRKYLSPQQVDYLSGKKIPTNKNDSAAMERAEDRGDEYFMEAVTMEIINSLEQGIEKLEEPGLEGVNLLNYKDSIAEYAGDWSSGKLENYFDALARWTGKAAFKDLSAVEPPVFRQLDKEIRLFENVLMAEEYTVEVEMPGLITATNSEEVLGNTVSWPVLNMSYFFEDYEMMVESRVVNYWAFWLSGIVVLLLLIALIVKLLR